MKNVTSVHEKRYECWSITLPGFWFLRIRHPEAGTNATRPIQLLQSSSLLGSADRTEKNNHHFRGIHKWRHTLVDCVTTCGGVSLPPSLLLSTFLFSPFWVTVGIRIPTIRNLDFLKAGLPNGFGQNGCRLVNYHSKTRHFGPIFEW